MNRNATNCLARYGVVLLMAAGLSACGSDSDDNSSTDDSGTKPTPVVPTPIDPDNPTTSILGSFVFDEATTHTDRFYDAVASFTNNGDTTVNVTGMKSSPDITIVENTCSGALKAGEVCKVKGKFRPITPDVTYTLKYEFESDEVNGEVVAYTNSKEPVLWYTATPLTQYSQKNASQTSVITYYNNTDTDMTRNIEITERSFADGSGFKNLDNCTVIKAHSSCSERVYLKIPDNIETDLYAKVKITDDRGNSSILDFNSKATFQGVDYAGMDYGVKVDPYSINNLTEEYYEVGQTYTGRFFARIWDYDNDSNLIYKGMEVETNNGNVAIAPSLEGDECANYISIDGETSESVKNCYITYKYTPDHVGPVDFKFINKWTNTNGGANNVSVWEEHKNVVPVIDIDVLATGQYSDVLAFQSEDIFKGQWHDPRFNLMVDPRGENGLIFDEETDYSDPDNLVWNYGDDIVHNEFDSDSAGWSARLSTVIGETFYPFTQADPQYEFNEVPHFYVLSMNYDGLDANDVSDSATLIVKPWFNQPATHKINLNVITAIEHSM